MSNARPELPTFYYPSLAITLQRWDMAVDSQGMDTVLPPDLQHG
ncbi:MAG TPA: hypothetical protein VLK82_26050 [Candidatus Tectomicrobia bacterium]|nr:hypothetical protein [Candidatus Tectomicrobia bacterium]